jgi:hypothetical protein
MASTNFLNGISGGFGCFDMEFIGFAGFMV